MCVTFIFTSDNPQESNYKLILLNSRDEVIARPTSRLAWEDGILAGRDEAAPERGTWLGVTETGKIGVLLSITEPSSDKNPKAPSRGGIVKNYLASDLSAEEYNKRLAEECTQYNGFQFVAVDRTATGDYKVNSVTNKLIDSCQPTSWPHGIHGFGNSPPAIQFQKVLRGTQLFTTALGNLSSTTTESEIIEHLFSIARDTQRCLPDDQLVSQTGYPSNVCGFLSSLFVVQQPGSNYGTRSHTVILIDQKDNVTVAERSLVSGTNLEGTWDTKINRFIATTDENKRSVV